jgi:hypothetical protein
LRFLWYKSGSCDMTMFMTKRYKVADTSVPIFGAKILHLHMYMYICTCM